MPVSYHITLHNTIGVTATVSVKYITCDDGTFLFEPDNFDTMPCFGRASAAGSKVSGGFVVTIKGIVFDFDFSFDMNEAQPKFTATARQETNIKVKIDKPGQQHNVAHAVATLY